MSHQFIIKETLRKHQKNLIHKRAKREVKSTKDKSLNLNLIQSSCSKHSSRHNNVSWYYNLSRLNSPNPNHLFKEIS